jgi:hypothetical protein
MDGLCERGGVDVEFVERDDVFLVVRSRGLDLVKDFWRASAIGAGMFGSKAWWSRGSLRLSPTCVVSHTTEQRRQQLL